MARQLASRVKHDTGSKITTKTPYGTTSDMVVTDENILSSLEMAEGTVLAKDDIGYYFTPANRVDSKLADPNRYTESRRKISAGIEQELSNPK
jgi:hypothetical protein